MNATLAKLRDTKDQAQLAHLFIDKDDHIRDRHIEDMWTHLYTGKPIDAIFRTNFCMYHGYLTSRPKIISANVFDNVSVARRWVGKQYGSLTCDPFDPAAFEYDETLIDKRFVARLVSPLAASTGEHCYSPTELGAILLTVVNVFRSMASDYIDQLAS